MRRKIEKRNIRKIAKRGGSYSVNLPIEMMRKLKWKSKQKVVVSQKGTSILITDWKEK